MLPALACLDRSPSLFALSSPPSSCHLYLCYLLPCLRGSYDLHYFCLGQLIVWQRFWILNLSSFLLWVLSPSCPIFLQVSSCFQLRLLAFLEICLLFVLIFFLLLQIQMEYQRVSQVGSFRCGLALMAVGQHCSCPSLPLQPQMRQIFSKQVDQLGPLITQMAILLIQMEFCLAYFFLWQYLQFLNYDESVEINYFV